MYTFWEENHRQEKLIKFKNIILNRINGLLYPHLRLKESIFNYTTIKKIKNFL